MFKTRYGRINRLTYFLCFAILFAGYAILLSFARYKPPAFGEFLAMMIAVPRLHDIGKSGWWMGGAVAAELFVVLVALPFAISTNNDHIILRASGLFIIVALGLMVWLGCVRGQPDANSYGEPPPPGLSLKTYSMTKAPTAEGPSEA